MILKFPNLNFKESASTTTSTSSGSFADLITLSALVSTGFPVEVGMHDGTIFVENTAGTNAQAEFRILRDATPIALFVLRGDEFAGASNRIDIPAGCLRAKEFSLSPGSYVYKLQARVIVASSVGVTSAKMFAEEPTHF